MLGASWRWATVGSVELRSSLGLGASMLLHDRVGAPAGSVGPLGSLSLINAVLPGPGNSRFEVRPEAALLVPSLRGVPVAYHQYRVVVTMRLD